MCLHVLGAAAGVVVVVVDESSSVGLSHLRSKLAGGIRGQILRSPAPSKTPRNHVSRSRPLNLATERLAYRLAPLDRLSPHHVAK